MCKLNSKWCVKYYFVAVKANSQLFLGPDRDSTSFQKLALIWNNVWNQEPFYSEEIKRTGSESGNGLLPDSRTSLVEKPVCRAVSVEMFTVTVVLYQVQGQRRLHCCPAAHLRSCPERHHLFCIGTGQSSFRYTRGILTNLTVTYITTALWIQDYQQRVVLEALNVPFKRLCSWSSNHTPGWPIRGFLSVIE